MVFNGIAFAGLGGCEAGWKKPLFWLLERRRMAAEMLGPGEARNDAGAAGKDRKSDRFRPSRT